MNLVCVIGDVCGKEVDAALFMTLFRSLIRAASTSGAFSGGGETPALLPAQLLSQAIAFTNKYVAETHGDADMFATIFISLLNPASGKLSYINCGNEPPLLLGRGGIVTALRPTAPAIGVIPSAKFSVQEIEMEENSLLLAFTDGIPDALNSAGEPFGQERLLKSLKEGEGGPAALLEKIADQLGAFIGSAEQFDDITLVAVKRGA